MAEAVNHCNHFVVRKKRHCRMLVKPGETYCGEHQPSSEASVEAEGAKIRIVCPLDRKHTCYAHNLKKHLKICNARPAPKVPYIQEGINSGKTQHDEEIPNTYTPLSTFPVKDIMEVIAKVNRIYSDLLTDKVTTKFSAHKIVEDEMLKPEYGDKTKKHLKQASAILGLLDEYSLIQPNTCYIEFGAGRGHLSYWLAQATESLPNSSFLLIERSSPKHKCDNKLDKTEDAVKRIRADIADLILDKLDAVTKCQSLVGVTKHLCGDATDLAIRCLCNVAECDSKVSGCIMTFCCHHRCRWTPYTGKDFFEEVGMTRNDFEMMCGMTSWATCGTGFSRERQIDGDFENGQDVVNERDKEMGLNREQKGEVGKKCKSIINWGRSRYLEKLGFECRLHFYVSADVSLENVCIVAHKKNKTSI